MLKIMKGVIKLNKYIFDEIYSKQRQKSHLKIFAGRVLYSIFICC